MHAILNRPSRILQIAAAMLPLVTFACPARADIFQWEYINPADPSQGKQQSTTLCPAGAGVDAVPGAFLGGYNLAMAYLIGADLTDAYFGTVSTCGNSSDCFASVGTMLAGADFASANVRGASFDGANLTDADFTGADVRGARFSRQDVCPRNNCQLVGGITLSQLYSTASYQAHDLSGINLYGNELTGGNFTGQNLTNASFYNATLTDADFSDAEVRGASFGTSYYANGITLGQLYSTASYHAHDLTGIGLRGKDLSGANFAGQNLTNADFNSATLIGANFTGAELRGTSFFRSYDVNRGIYVGGITLAQLYSTASYQAHDLSGINLYGNELTGGNFTGQNLTNASFYNATLTGAYFTAADARGAYLLYSGPNLIRPDGHIVGLDLNDGGLLVVRDYDGDFRYEPDRPPILITIEQHLAMGPDGTLRMVFEADAWDSTVSFAPGIVITLGGTLELTFAADVNLPGQIGRTFDLFDWTGVSPTGAFAVSSPYSWNLSNLYITGEVTLTAIPEPTGFAIAAGAFSLTFFRRRKIP